MVRYTYKFYTLEVVQKQFAVLVDEILSIYEHYAYSSHSQARKKVKALERQIDQMVYKLYGLREKKTKKGG